MKVEKTMKEKKSTLRKDINKLDPTFEDKIRMLWNTPPIREKDLKKGKKGK